MLRRETKAGSKSTDGTRKRPSASAVWRESRDLIWEHRGRLGLGLSLMLVNRLSGLVLPATSKYLVDEVIGKHRAELLGISVDGAWCHVAYATHRRFHFPLLSDFEPKGAVAKTYGVYAQEQGTSGRALFVLDEEGTIRWSYVSPIGVNPGADGILMALEQMDAVHAS